MAHCPSGDPYPKATGPLGRREGTLQVISACLSPNPLTPTPSDHPHRRQASTCPGARGRGEKEEPARLPAAPLSSLHSDKELTLVSVGVWETLGGLAARAALSPPHASPPGWHRHTSEPRGGALTMEASPAWSVCVYVCVSPAPTPWWEQRCSLMRSGVHTFHAGGATFSPGFPLLCH